MPSYNKFFPKGIFYRFSFGHYKGLTLLDVFSGRIPLPGIVIRHIVESVLQKVEIKELKDYSVITDGRFITVTPPFGYWGEKNDSYADIIRKGQEEYDELKKSAFEKFNKFFEGCMQNLYQKHPALGNPDVYDINKLELTKAYSGETFTYELPSDLSLFLMTPSPSYVEYCISNMDDFFIKDDVLNFLESVEVRGFAGLSINKKTDTIFELVQYQKGSFFKFSSKSREINAVKIKKYNQLVEQAAIDDLEKILSPEDAYEEPRRRYTDQDYINDAFGGEASAYWNID